MADSGLLIAEGEKRGRVYAPGEALRAIRKAALEAFPPPRATEDPFKAQKEFFALGSIA
jgi:hypothetical protein